MVVNCLCGEGEPRCCEQKPEQRFLPEAAAGRSPGHRESTDGSTEGVATHLAVTVMPAVCYYKHGVKLSVYSKQQE